MEFANILAEITFLRTYAKIKEDGTKETWEETIGRVCNMHIKKFPLYKAPIERAFEQVKLGRVVPSMRSLQFAGPAIERDNCRLYNCSYLPIDCLAAFGEYIYLLMNGTGVGYSVQLTHVNKLPPIIQGSSKKVFTVPDTREGWADSVKALINNPNIRFDYTQVRPEGAPLSTGGTASGPEPLREAHESIREILLGAARRKLKPIEVMDIVDLCASFVVVGGARRAASICLFDPDDTEMLKAKSGEWYTTHPWRAYSNNSAVLNPDTCTYEQFDNIMNACFEGGYGEPGMVMLRDSESYAINPCAEIYLKNNSFCNLTEVNMNAVQNKEEFKEALHAATLIGTLQATYTDFTYLRDVWKRNTEEQALLGISFTGLGEHWDKFTELVKEDVTEMVKQVNEVWADCLGINPAKRIGCVKPSGTTSVVLGTTSGIHAAHAKTFLRRVRINKTNPLAKYLVKHVGMNDFILQDNFDKTNIVVSVPMRTEEGAIIRREESALDLLERAKWVHDNWIKPTHREGGNTHNVSLTVSYKKSEENQVKGWMWYNRTSYTGISLLPMDDNKYPLAPFEEIDEETYQNLSKEFSALVGHLDLKSVVWQESDDERKQTVACSGGSCELT